jgi:hypothetical protein
MALEDMMPHDASPTSVQGQPNAEPILIGSQQVEPVQPAQQELIEVKVDGQVKQVTLDELKEMYSKGEHFTQKMQKLSEREKELEALVQFANTLDQRPDVVQAIDQMLFSTNPSQAEQYNQQYAGTGNAPAVDPRLIQQTVQSELQQFRQEMQYEQAAMREIQAFERTHPDIDIDKVLDFAEAEQQTSLENAFILMSAKESGALNQQRALNQQAQVEHQGTSQASVIPTARPRDIDEAWKMVKDNVEL